MEQQHIHIGTLNGQWYAIDTNGKWLTASETMKAIASGATYKFNSPDEAIISSDKSKGE